MTQSTGARKCPLSGHPAEIIPLENSLARRVKCPACGTYDIDDMIAADLQDLSGKWHDKRYLLSALTRRATEKRQRRTISYQLFDSIAPPEGPQEILDRVLLYISERASSFSSPVRLNPDTDYPIAVARNPQDFASVISDAINLGMLEQSGYGTKIAWNGWDRVNELRGKRIDLDQAFVAMWFDPNLESAWKEGIKPALEEVGYSPIRIDEKQFNDKIDDQIVAEIRRSALLIADVTGHRAGVYFEAGFALGLGIQVVWTCREDAIKEAHFDTRQYNHIVWKDAADLKARLVNRILATGLGKAKQSVEATG
ncbi:MAG: hypothetical protein HYU29_04750 [Chloroflexi bacterium]|nr:hypothetical protein [Chloroflexota bacterium]